MVGPEPSRFQATSLEIPFLVKWEQGKYQHAHYYYCAQTASVIIVTCND